MKRSPQSPPKTRGAVTAASKTKRPRPSGPEAPCRALLLDELRGLRHGLKGDARPPARERTQASRSIAPRRVVDVPARRGDVRVSHPLLHVRDRELADGHRSEGVPEVVESQPAQAGALGRLDV